MSYIALCPTVMDILTKEGKIMMIIFVFGCGRKRSVKYANILAPRKDSYLFEYQRVLICEMPFFFIFASSIVMNDELLRSLNRHCLYKLVLCTQMKKFPISGFILVVGYQITNKISNVAPSPLHLSSKT